MSTLPYPPAGPSGQSDAPSDAADLGAAHGFAIGLDGRMSGDDGRQGRLAPAVHYAARMAAQLDGALGLGQLRHLHAAASWEFDVRVGWGMGGECLLEGVVRTGAASTPLSLAAASPLHPPRPRHVSEAIWVLAQQATRTAAQMDDAVRRLHASTGAAWTILLDDELTALRLLGDIAPGQLAVLSSRAQGVVHGLGEPGLATLTLVYDTGSLVVMPVDRTTLVFFVGLRDLTQVADVVRTARRTFSESAPAPAPAPVAEVEVEPEPEPEPLAASWNDERIEVPTGARFAGMVRAERVRAEKMPAERVPRERRAPRAVEPAREPDTDGQDLAESWNDERVEVPAGARFAGMVRAEREPREQRSPRWRRR